MTDFLKLHIVVAVACLLFGCGRNSGNNPAPPSAVTADTQQLAAEIDKQLAEQMEQRNLDLEKQKLILLVDGIRDIEHKESVSTSVERLINTESGNWSVASKGGYGHSSFISISPVADVEAAAAKIDFGTVLAVDCEQRTIVVDAGAKPIARPAAGWPGARGVREFIGRKTAAWAVENAAEDLIQEVGAEKALIVCYPGSTDEDAWSDASDAQLQELATKHEGSVRTTCAYPSQGDCRIATIGPIASVPEFVEALAPSVLWTDEKLRVIVLERPADKSTAKQE
jgi:hypothetical protein